MLKLLNVVTDGTESQCSCGRGVARIVAPFYRSEQSENLQESSPVSWNVSIGGQQSFTKTRFGSAVENSKLLEVAFATYIDCFRSVLCTTL